MDFLSNIFAENNSTIGFIKMLIPAFMAILFLQSGLDKIFNYKNNEAYFKDHFKSSVLANSISILMPVITVLEVAAGICSTIGILMLFWDNEKWALWGLILSALSFLSLFFGQRVAKDYGGAVTIVTYFILNMLGFFVLVLF
jgi:uncharacterized membrane protein YphA (DoxX/SURF4 family)